MGGESWTMAGKLCDSCKSATATLFCRADSAFLCVPCDTKVHLANKLASRHARVWICEVCEQAPASVTCKADAAALCASCDHDIHSANPLARRHERFPVVPFYEPAATAPKYSESGGGESEEEAEAASWILPNPVNKVVDLFSDVDPYLDLDLISDHQNQQADCLVPAVVDGVPCFDVVDYSGSKPYLYNFNTQTITPTLSSSSSMEVGVVPEHEVSTSSLPSKALSGVDREARVMRYREKRKNRKFEKTIRYASRKAYAETRPRVKGRFAKRTTVEDGGFSLSAMVDGGYGVVPSF